MRLPKTLKPLYKEIIRQLQKSGIDNADLDARIIISERTGFDWSDIVTKPDEKISDNYLSKIQNDVNQRRACKPLSRIYGQSEFWGLPFKISEDTLDPRPDTELIIDIAVNRIPKESLIRILDLGTGSGCILISLLSEFPNAVGYGIDLSVEALKIAKENAILNNFEERIHFINGSWLDVFKDNDMGFKFDLIVSNPPYITNQVIPSLGIEVREYDPILSLSGGDDGLQAYKNIFPKLNNYLNHSGFALFEIGYDQEKDVMRLAEDAGFALRTVHHDLAGNPRVVDISNGDK